MARARIEILGDSSSYQRSVREAAVVTNTLSLDMKKLAVSAESSAALQVKASVAKTARLRNEITVYREIAAASTRGSREQIAASNLAARAQRNLAGSLGVTAHESRTLSASSARVERDLGSATRGALAGSGVFRSLGRSIVYAGGGFLAFTSAAALVRKSIDVARAAAVTQRQLGAQFKASGLDLKTYQGEIDKTNLRLSALDAITKDQLDQSFTTIFRGTANVSKALKDEAVAADIAAGRHIDLAAASIAVGKAAAGSTTSLRRLGIELPKGTTGVEAIALAAEKFKGQAAAAATEQQRFGVALHNAEVIVGTALLPTLNKYLAEGARWLNQMNESGRLQKDVSKITKDVSGALHDAGAVAKVVAGVFRDLNKVTGSTENTLKDFASFWVLWKTGTALSKLGLIRSGIARAGGAAEVSTGEVAGLSGALGRLSTIGPIVIGVEILIHRKQVGDAIGNLVGGGTFGKALSKEEQFALGLISGQTAADFFTNVAHGKLGLGGKSSDNGLGNSGLIHSPLPPFNPRFAPTTKNGPAPPTPRGLSLQGQFNLAELRLANAQLTATSADDRAILVTEEAIVKQQIEHAKKLKDRIALTQQLVGIVSQVRGIDQADATAAKEAARAAKEAAKAARERAQTLLQTREFRVLGLDATGQPFTPKLGALRGELARVRASIKGTSFDTRTNEGLLGNITKLLFGKDANSLTKDVRATVKQMLDGLRDELKNGLGDNRTKFHVVDTDKVLAGLGLTPAQIRIARGRLTQLGAGGVAPRPGGAFGVTATTAHITLESHTYLDGREIAKNTTKHQQTLHKQKSGTRRGRNAGR